MSGPATVILEELSRQRVVMEFFSAERERAIDALVRAFAAERNEMLRSVESQRLATLEWASAERGEVIAEVRRDLAGSMDAVRGERAIVVDDLRHIVDMVLLRVAIFLVAAVVLARLIAHGYAHVWAAAIALAADMTAAGRRSGAAPAPVSWT